jgi:uncharacterized protein YbjT (DUF2867 family)
MRIAIIGAHGKVARLLTPLLHESGHQVTAVVRNPDHVADVEADGASGRVFDIESADVDALAELLSGHDAVVWSAGAGGGSPQRTYAVDRDAAIRSMEAAARSGVGRYVMVSYFGAGPGHGVAKDNPFFAYADAKTSADAALAQTDLAWTILRPSGLTTDAGTRRIETSLAGASPGSVSRADVALVAAETLARPGLAGATVEFNNGEVPVDEALAAYER